MSSSPDVTGGRVVRNTSVNAIAGVVSALLTVVLTPYLLHRLGAAEYGVWLLGTTLTLGSGYLAVADLGLSQATVKFIAEARARRDTEAVNQVVSSTTAVFAAVGAVLAVVIVSGAGLLTQVFNIAPSLRPVAREAFALVGAQVVVDLPAAALLAVAEGAQRYLVYRVVDLGARVLWAVLVLVAVAAGHGVVALAAISFGVAVVRWAAAYVGAATVQPGFQLRVAHVRRQVLRQVTGFASRLFAIRILSVIYWQMDRAIIGVVLSAAAVARYEVAFRIHSTALFALSIIPSAVMPAAAYLAAADDTTRLRALYLRGTKYAVGISLPITLSALLFAPWIIATWVGAEYLSVTWPARLFLVYPLLAVVHVIALAILVGLGRMREVLALTTLSVGVNLVISLVLAPEIGITGVITGTLAGYVVIWVPYTRLFLREFDVTLREWAVTILVPAIPGCIVQVLVALGISHALSRPDSLAVVGALVALDIGVGVLTFVVLGLGGDERRRFREMVLTRDAAVAEPPAEGATYDGNAP